MLGLGPMELAIILVIVLVVFGAKRVPEIGASFGKGIRDFKRALSDTENQIRQPDAKPAERLSAGPAETVSPSVREETPAREPKRLI
jgi:sec-independent protein translocase protein TatA